MKTRPLRVGTRAPLLPRPRPRVLFRTPALPPGRTGTRSRSRALTGPPGVDGHPGAGPLPRPPALLPRPVSPGAEPLALPAPPPRPRRPWLLDAVGALAFFLLSLLVPLGPDGALEALGAPRETVIAAQRALVHRWPVVSRRPLLSARGRDGSQELAVDYAFLGREVAALGTYLVVFGLALGWLQLRGARPRALFLLTREGARITVRLTAIAGGVLGAGALAAGLVAARVGGGAALAGFLDGLHMPLLEVPAGRGLVIAIMVVAAPLAEEVVFRGIVYHALRKRLSVGFAAVFQASAFAAYHVNAGWPPELLPLQYGFALLAVYALERTGSLAAPVLLHALGNGAGVLALGLATAYPELVLAFFQG